MCNISHTEVTNNASFTELANNTSVNSEQDFIDVGEENYIGDSESKKSSADLMNGTILSEIRKSDNNSSVSKGDIVKLSNIKPKPIKVKPKGDKKDKDKSKLSDNLKVKRKKSDDSVIISDKVKKKTVRKVKKEKVQEVKKKERKKSGGGNKEKIQKTVSQHGWTWEGEPEMRTVTSIVSVQLFHTYQCNSQNYHTRGAVDDLMALLHEAKGCGQQCIQSSTAPRVW